MKKLIALMLALVMALSMAACAKAPNSPAPTDPTTPTKDPATLDEVYRRGSYTGDADALITNQDTVVATLGDATLTNGLLQIYYWMGVYDFLSSNGNTLSQYGLDITKPLDAQTCPETDGTWQHYFLSNAIAGWRNYQSLAMAGEEAQLPLSNEYQKILDGLDEELAQEAAKGGYASIDAMIQADAGPGCTAEDHYRYTELFYTAYNYFNDMFYKIEVTDDMINEYFTEHEASLAVNGINKNTGDSYLVRHILFQVAETKTDDDWDACHKKAQDMLDQWLAGEATEDSFAALAKEHSEDPGSKAAGGLYSGLSDKTSFVKEFKDWYLDKDRKAGDYGLVKTSYGYHIMYFSGTEPIWVFYCREAVTDKLSTENVADAMEKHEIVINYDKILLGDVKLIEDK
jgi:hypothetical protein